MRGNSVFSSCYTMRTFMEQVSVIQVAISSMVGHWPAPRIFTLCNRECEDTELPCIRNYPTLPYLRVHTQSLVGKGM